MSARCELDERGKRIVVHFPYDPRKVEQIKGMIPGRKFVGRENGGPHWTVPLDLDSARTLRRIFPAMELGPRLTEWGRQQVTKEREILSVAGADDAELKRLPVENPALYEFISSRPYQRADVAQMALQSTVNANEPSLGKTVESIAAIWEAGLEDGPQLVIVPTTAIETVWVPELTKFDGAELLIWQGPYRHVALARAQKLIEEGEPFYLLTNYDQLRLRPPSKDMEIHPEVEEVLDIEWNTVIVDEYHKSGLGNEKTAFFKAIKKLKYKRFYPLSGTPIGGKPIRLWPALNVLDPVTFSSKWNWAGKWLDIEPGWGNSKKIGGIKHYLEDAFYEGIKPYVIRRTKAEVRKELPPKIFVPVWCTMTPAQAKRYQIMAEETEIRIDEEHLSASNVLALYTRLKQFAATKCDIRTKGDTVEVNPTFDSGKLPQLMERLEERGISKEPEGDTRVLIGTQFKKFAYLMKEYIEVQTEGNVRAEVISGDTKNADRLKWAGPTGEFEKGDLRVLILVVGAGDVALNLDRAESVHMMDETWNPDNTTQLTDRGHRFTGLTVYMYRTRGTIEEYIQQINIEKQYINDVVLDLRRNGILHA
jgi:SNF2 family DNA or RNA helicase